MGRLRACRVLVESCALPVGQVAFQLRDGRRYDWTRPLGLGCLPRQRRTRGVKKPESTKLSADPNVGFSVWALQKNELDLDDPLGWPAQRRETHARILNEQPPASSGLLDIVTCADRVEPAESMLTNVAAAG
jgi:hypothetical protein